MRHLLKRLCMALAITPAGALAEDFMCAFRWSDKQDALPMLIEVRGDTAVTKGGYIDAKFRVLENSSDELIIVKTSTKTNSGADYPVGAVLVVVDKATGNMVRSNTYMKESFNNHAFGNCERVAK